MTGTDLLLVFPPLTEARHFPYLSLPQLTGYLRGRGHRVQQHDLNIELVHGLFSAEALAGVRPQPSSTVAQLFGSARAQFLTEHDTELWQAAFGKQPSPDFPPHVAVQLVQQGVELVLRDSAWYSIPDTYTAVAAHADRLPEDLPARTARELLLDVVRTHRPRVVGFSVAFFSQLVPALHLAAWVKAAAPQTVVVLGGQQVMLRADRLAALPAVRANVDALCVTAGEQPLDRLLADPGGDLGAVPGMLAVDGPGGQPEQPTLQLRDLPVPDFAGLPVRQYLNTEVQLPVATCVGCYWGRCVYCSYGNRSLLPGAYQQYTQTQIADACEAAVTRWGVTDLTIADENTNLRLLVRGLRELRERGVSITFRVRNRLEPVLTDLSFCRELADLGCAVMSCGYETNTQRLLDMMDKGVAADTYQRIVDNLHEAGIRLRLSVMGGLFDESQDEAAASRQFLVDNAGKVGIDVLQMLVLEPGTLLAEDPARYALDVTDGDGLQSNPTFSYLGGRYGARFDYRVGADRAGRAQELARVFAEVRPAKNADLPPRLRPRAATQAADGDVFRLHPWIQVLTAGGGRRYVADLAWPNAYVLPGRVGYDRRGHALHVDVAQPDLRRALIEADLGVFSEGEERP